MRVFEDQYADLNEWKPFCHVSNRSRRATRLDNNLYWMQCKRWDCRVGWPLNVFSDANQKTLLWRHLFPPYPNGKICSPILPTHLRSTKISCGKRRRLWQLIESQRRTEKYGIAAGAQDFRSDELAGSDRKLRRTIWIRNGEGNESNPKFPMPAHHGLLSLTMHFSQEWRTSRKVFFLPFRKMGMGGIYDQLRGGFSRYSWWRNGLLPTSKDGVWTMDQLSRNIFQKAYQISQDPIFLRK